MKKLGKLFMLLALVCFALCALSACSSSQYVVDDPSAVRVSGIEGEVSDLRIYQKQKKVTFSVSEEAASFSAEQIKLKIAEDVTYTVYTDKELTDEVGETVRLAVGENVFFVKITTADEEEVVYTFVVTRQGNSAHGAHIYGEWTVVRQSSCTQQGKKERVCSVCGHKETETIPKRNHEYVDGVCVHCGGVAPTETLGLVYTLKDDDTYEVIGYTGSETSVVIPAQHAGKAVTSIREDTFCVDGCPLLTSVTIGSGVTTIEDGVFGGQTFLTSVVFEEGSRLTTIGAWTFAECMALTSIAIPDSVTTIEEEAFISCYNLTDVTFGENSRLTEIKNGVFYDCKSLANITIPDSVTSIGSMAFWNCSSLTSVTIPDSVTSIGERAFYGCYKLVEVYNKSSLNITEESSDYGNVGYYAKAVYTAPYESKLSTDADGYILYTDGEDISLIGYTGTDTELTLPAGITEINHGALARFVCWDIVDYEETQEGSLASVTIPNSVTHIGDCAFYASIYLTDITFLGTKEEWNAIEKEGDMWNSEIGTGTIHCLDGDVHEHSFVYKETVSRETCAEPGSVLWKCGYCEETKLVEKPALGHADYVAVVTAPTCTERGYTMYTCSRCGDSYVDTYVDALGHELVHHDGKAPTCTETGWAEYDACTRCRYTTYQEIVALGHDYQGGVCIRCGATERAGTEGIVYKLKEDGTYAVTGYKGQSTEVVIPSSHEGKDVTAIGEQAFIGNNSITSVTIQGGVKEIGSYAFAECTSLREVTLGKNVEVINSLAFCACFSLKKIALDDKVTKIGIGAFNSCISLMEITIPSGVTTIENAAFAGCYRLVRVVNKSSVELGYKDILSSAALISRFINFKSVGFDSFIGCYEFVSDEADFVNVLTTDAEGVITYTVNNADYLLGCTGENDYLDVSDYTFTKIFPCAFNADTLLYVLQEEYDGEFDKTICISNRVTEIGFLGLVCSTVRFEGTKAEWSAIGSCDLQNAIINVFVSRVICSDGDVCYFYIDENGLAYTFTDETASVTSCSNHEVTRIDIPSEIFGYSVTSIGEDAFRNSDALTSITIPDSVTNIGENAFEGCPIETATIPAMAISYIPKTALRSVTITSGTSIPDYAFGACYHLTNITISDSVTSIGNDAFSSCPIETATIPAMAISYIPETALRSVTITGGTIEETAFMNCESLTSVTIGSGVTSIWDWAFSGCTSLTSVYYTGDIASWCGITFGDYDANPLYYVHNLYINNELVTDLVIPDGVTEIKNYAFNGGSFTHVMIPDSVTSIGWYSFEDCTSLTSVTIPDSVTSIGSGAFSSCPIKTATIPAMAISYIPKTALRSVTITSGTSIPDYAFGACYHLTNITISDSVMSIGKDAFSGCTASIVWGENSEITTIGQYAFGGYQGVSITIPDSVTSIGAYAFSGCPSLTSITIPDNVTSIGYGAFSGCSGLTSMTVPFVGGSRKTSSDTYQYPFGYIFGTSSYTGSTAVEQYYYDSSTVSRTSTTYYIPSSLRSVTVTGGNILFGAFYNCVMLTNVTIPDGVTSIGDSAFYGCHSLTNITIPDGVTSIGDHAFYNCSGLTSITIPNSVTSIGERAFYGCYKLVEVYNKSSLNITKGSENYGYVSYYAKNVYTEEDESKLSTDENGYILYTDGEEISLMGYSGAGTVLTLPAGITKIYQYAFYKNKNITSITIPDGVTSIGYCAFYECTSLTSITLPDSVTSIGYGVFYNCASLTSITYQGTKAQWNAISKGSSWNSSTGAYTIYCTDGDIVK